MSDFLPLDATARAVIDSSGWFAIATHGAAGPHMAACWTRNIIALGYADTEILVPVWRMEQTEHNLRADPRIELLFVSAEIQRKAGSGQGISCIGTGEILRSGLRVERARATLGWIKGILVVTLHTWRFHLP